MTCDSSSLLFFFVYMKPQVLDVQQQPGNMVSAHPLCLGAHKPVVQIIEDPEASSTKGSEDCVHAPCGCSRCQSDTEGEDHKLVDSAPRLEPKEAPMPSPDRHLLGRLWQTSRLDLWPGVPLGPCASCTKGVADTGSGLLSPRLDEGLDPFWGSENSVRRSLPDGRPSPLP